eukprot:6067440-Pyramimonas_sp.AAC.1
MMRRRTRAAPAPARAAAGVPWPRSPGSGRGSAARPAAGVWGGGARPSQSNPASNGDATGRSYSVPGAVCGKPLCVWEP